MQQVLYNIHYRMYGIRRIQHLLMPRMFPADVFTFPKSSVYHHIGFDENHQNPDPGQPFFKLYRKRIMTNIVSQMTASNGNARRNSLQPQILFRDFFLKNRIFKFMRESVTTIKDPNSLVVVNYGYLPSLYRYTELPLTPYFQWQNIEKTVWDTVSQLTQESERHHFIFFDVPDVLPSVTMLRLFSNKVNNTLLKVFNTPEKLFILELWRWIDPETRHETLLGQLTQEQLERVNIVFVYHGKWCELNLGLFNKWRKTDQDKKDELKNDLVSSKVKNDGETNGIQFGPPQIQKLLLKFLIAIQSQNPIVEEPLMEKPHHGVDPEANDEDSDNDDLMHNKDVEIETSTKNGEILKNEQPDVDTNQSSEISADDTDDNQLIGHDHFEDLEDELKALEFIEKKTLATQGVKVQDIVDGKEDTPATVEQKTSTDPFAASEEDIQRISEKLFQEKNAKEELIESINKYAEYGLMTASEYKSALKQAEVFSQSTSPYHENQTVEQYVQIQEDDLVIKPEEIKLPDIETVPDKSMLNSTLTTFDSKYIEQIMPKDILGAIHNFQKAGIIIQDYSVETENSILGEYEIHTLRVKPIDGAASTIRFRLPKVDSEGNFVANGNKYHMRKQRADLPIRKIDYRTVGLTSYYGKVFVKRSEKKVNDSIEWLAKQILLIGQSGESQHITRVAPANVFDNAFKAPRIYSGLARHFKSVDLGPYRLMFDHKERFTLIASDAEQMSDVEKRIKTIEGETYRLIGHDRNGNILLVDYHDEFYLDKNGALENIGDIYRLSLLDQLKAPVDFAELKIFAKTIPVGIVLSYVIGFTNLIKLLGVKPRVVEARQRTNMESHEWMIAFKDKRYIFSRKDQKATLVLAGFNEYHRSIKNFHSESFDQPNVYLNVLESNGIGARYLRELDLLDQLFVDPITRDILREMQEPTTFHGLIVRSAELLLLDDHMDSQDMRGQRIKGYERFAGAIYKEMVIALRDFKAKNIRGKSQIDLNPYSVWKNITQDPAVEIVKDINPIENLKQVEAVTYAGEGGRQKDAMVKKDRAYHASDIGIVSEATVDSSDVGINFYLTANPQLNSLRGIGNSFAYAEAGPSALLSTSALISPGSENDDMKRVNFVSIQQSHTISCDGYHQPYVRTGYEQVLAHRAGELFAVTAKEPGKVISKTDKGIVVEYESGRRQGVNLGRRYGRAEGSTYPHDIVSNLKEGETFTVGEAIAYNSGFFEPDFLNPKNIVWKSSLTVKTALYESSQTYEDSSSISKRLSGALSAKTTKVRSFVVDFKQGIRNVRKPGTELHPTDILFIIEDEVTNESGLFNEETLATLQRLSNKAPKAKVRGTIDRIEVFYHGSKEDMSPSLRALTNLCDKQLAEEAKAVNKPVFTGEVNEEYRVSGTPLALDTAEIKVYITIETKASTGDKGVFANQMKSVFGEVMDYEMTTAEGEAIDAVFGWKSIYNRQVLSPMLIGTTTSLLKVIAKQAVKLYRG